MTQFWAGIASVAFLVGVCGNLTAALIWAVPALRGLHAKLDRHHAEQLAQLRKGPRP